MVWLEGTPNADISRLRDDLETTIFENIPNPFEANRYHSLIVEKESLPDCLEVTAWTDEDEIMAIRHKEFTLEGLQFHPESILTPEGMAILKNFLNLKP